MWCDATLIVKLNGVLCLGRAFTLCINQHFILESKGFYLGVLLCQLAIFRLQVCNVSHCCWEPYLVDDK